MSKLKYVRAEVNAQCRYESNLSVVTASKNDNGLVSVLAVASRAKRVIERRSRQDRRHAYVAADHFATHLKLDARRQQDGAKTSKDRGHGVSGD